MSILLYFDYFSAQIHDTNETPAYQAKTVNLFLLSCHRFIQETKILKERKCDNSCESILLTF